MSEREQRVEFTCERALLLAALDDAVHVLKLHHRGRPKGEAHRGVFLANRGGTLEVMCLTPSQFHMTALDADGDDVDVQIHPDSAIALSGCLSEFRSAEHVRVFVSADSLEIVLHGKAGITVEAHGFIEAPRKEFQDTLVESMKGELSPGGVRVKIARLGWIIDGCSADDEIVLAVCDRGVHYRGTLERQDRGQVYVVGVAFE